MSFFPQIVEKKIIAKH